MKKFNVTINGHQVTNDDARKVLVRVQNNFKQYNHVPETMEQWRSGIEYLMEIHAFPYKMIDAAFAFVREAFTENNADDKMVITIEPSDIVLHYGHDAEKAENDAELENMADFCEFENDAMCEFNDAIENAKNELMDAENAIERELQYGTWTDSEIIGDAAQKAYGAILSVKTAVVDFCKKMSDYTECDFIIPDAYSELFIDTPKFYFEIDVDMSVEEVFYRWLCANVRGSDDADELCETLYHYLAVA